jgi:hypothetical protein
MAYRTKGIHLQLLMAVIMHHCLLQHGLRIINKKLSFQSALGSLSATTTWRLGPANLEPHVNTIILNTRVHLSPTICWAL